MDFGHILWFCPIFSHKNVHVWVNWRLLIDHRGEIMRERDVCVCVSFALCVLKKGSKKPSTMLLGSG